MQIKTQARNWWVDIQFYADNTIVDMSDEDIDSLWDMIKGIYWAICYKLWDRLYDWDEWKIYIDELLDLGIKNLQHHKDTTVWLYATDKPDIIPDDLKDRFFIIR